LKRGPPFKRPRGLCQGGLRGQKIFSDLPGNFAVSGACQVATLPCSRAHKSTARGDREDLRALNRASVEAEAGKETEAKEEGEAEAKPTKQRSRSEVLSQATKPLEVRKLKSGKEPAFYRGAFGAKRSIRGDEDDRGAVAHSVLSRSQTPRAGGVPWARRSVRRRGTCIPCRGIGAAFGGFPAAPRGRSHRPSGSPVAVGTEDRKVCGIADGRQRPVPNR
jgi:hypothetical protein